MKIYQFFNNPRDVFLTHLSQIYSGNIFLFPLAQEFSKELICELETELVKEFEMQFTYAEFFLSQEKHFQKLSSIREKLYSSPKWINLARNFLLKLGLAPNVWMFDCPRIRGIVTEKNRSPLAEPAYYVHRDTWYGNSESQINIWIPLCDIDKSNGFGFYLDYFNKPILNDSQNFDYKEWKTLGGYQSQNNNKIFPKPLISLSKENITYFECPRGGMLVFSASHLHGTLPNLSHQTRFSIDLRIVNLKHYFKQIGAPNVDNQSKGNNLEDMTVL